MKTAILIIAALLSGCAHKPAKATAPHAKPSWVKRHLGSVQGGPGGVL